MTYSPTNWKDYPDLSTAITAARLNNIESGVTNALITVLNANVDSAAAIAYSKLNLALSIVNGDISAAAAIALSKLAGYPNSASYFARGDGTWAIPPTPAVQAFTTLINENTTTTETDWVGTQSSGWTIPAGTLGSSDELCILIAGDRLVNGSSTPSSAFKFYLGGVAYISTGTFATLSTSAVTPVRVPFAVTLRVKALGATNSVLLSAEMLVQDTGSSGAAISAGTGVTQGAGNGPRLWTSAGAQTVDMTQAQALRFTHTWGTSNANNAHRIYAVKVLKL